MKRLTSLSLAAALMVVAATLTLADTASKNTAKPKPQPAMCKSLSCT